MGVLCSPDASGGKNALMKALLNLQNGGNNTVEFLLEISQRMGDLTTFVNAEYTNAYYKGEEGDLMGPDESHRHS